MSRYKKLSNYKGIRKDTKNGRYLATKYISGTEYSKKFTSLKQANNWRINFHPSLPEKVVERTTEEVGPMGALSPLAQQKLPVRLNGEDLGYRVKDVWKLYKSIHISSLERSSQEWCLAKELFLTPLMNFKMVELTAILLDRFIEKQKSIVDPKGKRCNFDRELSFLRAMLNWYRENYDPFFVNPVLKRHKKAGFIKKVPTRNKKMRPQELIAFFNELPLFWRDFAETQFYLGARVSEVAGLKTDSINLAEKEVRIQYVVVWLRNKKVEYIKEAPKNNEVSYASMNSRLEEIIRRRMDQASNDFLFHDEGKPLGYRIIQYQYNKALKRAGLSHKYSSTHIMRHSMGTITRRVTGSIDMAQAVTRHKDAKMAQHYADLPSEANKKAVKDVFHYLNGLEKELQKGRCSSVQDGPDTR